MTEVTFTRAKFSHRVFAFFFDFILMAILSLFLITATRDILQNVPYYKNAIKAINDTQEASHLYDKKDGVLVMLYDYYEIEDEEKDYDLYYPKLDEALKAFYQEEAFFPDHDGLDLYNKQKIDTGYFIYTDDTKTDTSPKDGVSTSVLYKTLASLMKNEAVNYFPRYPGYIEAVNTINYSFVFIILFLPILISFLIFEFIIPLCLRRGRKTLGKLVFKLGVVDARGLSPSFVRFLARTTLFFFFEIILSVLTFFIPLIVSSSMFTFSKANQSFHDYVAGTYVIDCSSNQIFMNEEEYKEKKQQAKDFVLTSDKVDLK